MCPRHCSLILRIYLRYPKFAYEWWRVGADCCVVKLSTSGLGAVIKFLVVGDA